MMMDERARAALAAARMSLPLMQPAARHRLPSVIFVTPA
jgi:hypothetical protein